MKLKNFLIPVLCFTLIVISASALLKNNSTLYSINDGLDLDAKAYCLTDCASGKILAEKNSNTHLEVASMVKLMTTLLTMEKIEKNEWTLDTELNVSDYAASMEGSQAFLDAGKCYKIDDLLKSVIIASANDSSVVLAENYAGTEQNFVNLMNNRAIELGMNNTLYANATGLPAQNQYSCANDIAKLLQVVSKHDIYHKYSTIWLDKLIHESGRVTELVNTNRLVKYYPGCDCGKTGFTDEAGYCLSASAKRNDLHLVSVLIGAKTSSDRFSLSTSLLNYGFNNFKSIKVVDAGNEYISNKKIKGLNRGIKCQVKDDLSILQKNGVKQSYNVVTNFNEIKSPIKKGDIIGNIEVVCDDESVCSTVLLASADYKTPTFIDILHSALNNWTL